VNKPTAVIPKPISKASIDSFAIWFLIKFISLILNKVNVGWIAYRCDGS